jgi:hypothetical protein
MRRTILPSLFALPMLLVPLAKNASAQRSGPARGFARRAFAFRPRASLLPYGFGYASLPYDAGAYDAGTPYQYLLQPIVIVQPAPPPLAAPEPPREVHPVVIDYKQPSAAPLAPTGELSAFAIVLKNGSTLSALSIVATDDGLRFVDPEDRHMRISMAQIDRTATLKLNRERGLTLHLPAAPQ